MWILCKFNTNFCVCAIIFALLSCGKEKISIPWEQKISGTTVALENIYFRDALFGVATGGNTWYNGTLLRTMDGGNSWQSIDTSSKVQAFYGLGVSALGTIFALSFNGYLYKMRMEDTHFVQMRHTWWHPWRDVAFWNDTAGLMIGGLGWQGGRMARLDAQYQVYQIDTILQELSGICYSEAHVVHAVGYGTVLRSTDAGKTWVRNPLKDDFYRSVHFPTAQVGYVVGSSGTIAKTTDGGEHWMKLRDGNALTTAAKPFLSVFFVNEQRGYIVGENGLMWRTLNGGSDWQIVEDLPNVHLRQVFVRNGQGWIVGEKGTILHFKE